MTLIQECRTNSSTYFKTKWKKVANAYFMFITVSENAPALRSNVLSVTFRTSMDQTNPRTN